MKNKKQRQSNACIFYWMQKRRLTGIAASERYKWCSERANRTWNEQQPKARHKQWAETKWKRQNKWTQSVLSTSDRLHGDFSESSTPMCSRVVLLTRYFFRTRVTKSHLKQLLLPHSRSAVQCSAIFQIVVALATRSKHTHRLSAHLPPVLRSEQRARSLHNL